MWDPYYEEWVYEMNPYGELRNPSAIIQMGHAENQVTRRQILPYEPEYDKKENHELLLFGPNYLRGETEWAAQLKQDSLDHVLRNSRCSSEELMNEIRSVEVEAKAAYPDYTPSNMSGDFCETMAKDGCLFLLGAFSILGAGPLLKFPNKHLIFGIGRVAEDLEWWLSSIFLVGNQVPLTVLRKLMSYLLFFRELKAVRNQWLDDHDHQLYKRTIHKFLMSDAGQEDDIIHCLQSVILGTSTSRSATTAPEMHQGIKKNEELHQYSAIIPSALLLSGKDVHFEKLEGELGVRNIHYKPPTLFKFYPVLYLPCFLVDDYTELMLDCLMKYEIVQLWTANIEPEASSYFGLLKELIPTTKDVEVLYPSGVIRGDLYRLRRLLFKFQFTGTSAHLYRIRQQINEDIHRRRLPWRKLVKSICVATLLALLLTYLQTQYTILSFYQNPS